MLILNRVLAVSSILFFSALGASPQLNASVDVEEVAHAQSLPAPAIHYPFDTDLGDVHGASTLTEAPVCPANPCNSAASFGSDADGKYWTWSSTNSRGGGFTVLTSANIGTSYTIALKFSFAQVTSWRKIIDYENRVTDNGFYYYSSKLQFYNGGATFNSVTSYPANTVLDLVVVRESTNPSDPSVLSGTFTVYAVGSDNSLTQLFQYSDTIGNSIPHVTSGGLTKLGFFFDDNATSSEATSNGKVYDLRIWSGASLSAQTLSAAVVRPSAVTNIVGTPASEAIDVQWASVTGATSYLASAGGQSCIVNAPSTTCRISGLTGGSSYTVSVQAIGPGGYSNVASSATPVIANLSSNIVTPTTTPTLPSVTTIPTAPSSPTAQNPTSDSDKQLENLPSTGIQSARALLGLLMLIIGSTLVGARRYNRHL
jgi:hypothetical protein